MKWKFNFFILPFLFFSNLTYSSTSAQLIQKWISLEKQIGEIESESHNKKKLLLHRVALLKKEQTMLKQIVMSNKHNNDEVVEKRLDLTEKQIELEKAQTNLNSNLDKITNYLSSVSVQLPPPLYADWKISSDEIINEANQSIKLEALLKFLQQIYKFNDRVAKHSGIIAIQENGKVKNIFVHQVYLGLSQGWYISEDYKYYGYGKPSLSGWQWWHSSDNLPEFDQEELKSNIVKIIEVLETPTDAQYVELPVMIQKRGKM
ncbi:DUF3450 family protein [Pseudoalteromonas phenolica]|uniref:DUF3450 family protein n=1 Tax=Pseudoalteromonas phenolica TaxID=161398 RepID=UPI00110A75CD|nr:DUF3450 family protein [Pseudoalteromonas phenolica]TMO57254.1 hypothetical protein CWC21_05075 [Pseudoalteromonas phenolica]